MDVKVETEMVLRAVQFALDAHGDQRRKSAEGEGAPYVVHPVACAQWLAATGADHQTVVAAVLHDVLEDTPVTFEELKKLFGSEVAEVVREVTVPADVRGAEEKKDWQVYQAPRLSYRAKLVKLADQRDNVRSVRLSPPPWSLERKWWYLRKCQEVVGALALEGVEPWRLGAFGRELNLTSAVLSS
jgi:GTP diphosphokinase / guanosine-3',5'-bis(diphosphate) 3'-diphosphatase